MTAVAARSQPWSLTAIARARLRADAAPGVDRAGAACPRRDWLPDAPPQAVILRCTDSTTTATPSPSSARSWPSTGIAVHAYDQRGFGANPAAGLWPACPALIDDLELERARIARAPSRRAGLRSRREHGRGGGHRRGDQRRRRSMPTASSWRRLRSGAAISSTRSTALTLWVVVAAAPRGSS